MGRRKALERDDGTLKTRRNIGKRKYILEGRGGMAGNLRWI